MATPAGSSQNNIGGLMVRDGLLSPEQLNAAVVRARQTDQPLMRVLVEDGVLDEGRRLEFYRRQFGVTQIELNGTHTPSPELAALIPSHVARKYHLVPVRVDPDGLVVAMEDPSDLMMLDDLKEATGYRIKPVLAPAPAIRAALDALPDNSTPGLAFPAVTGVTLTPTSGVAGLSGPRFDWISRFFANFFWPVLSFGALAAIAALLVYYPPFAKWLTSQITNEDGHPLPNARFTLFLYFFLSWGVWTLFAYELQGLVFQDMQWKARADVSPAPKSRMKALLLSVFLGFLGADRFYLGYTRMGILKLLTLALFPLWWLLDVVGHITGSIPDAAGRPVE